MSELPLNVVAGPVLEGDLGPVDCRLLGSQRKQSTRQREGLGAGQKPGQKEETRQGQGLGRLKVGAPPPASRSDLPDRIIT